MVVAVAAAAVAAVEDVLHQGARVNVHVERAGDERHGDALGLARLPPRTDAVVSQGDEASRDDDTERLV